MDEIAVCIKGVNPTAGTARAKLEFRESKAWRCTPIPEDVQKLLGDRMDVTMTNGKAFRSKIYSLFNLMESCPREKEALLHLTFSSSLKPNSSAMAVRFGAMRF